MSNLSSIDIKTFSDSEEVSGTFTTPGQEAIISCDGCAGLDVQIGTTGQDFDNTIQFEASLDGVYWDTIYGNSDFLMDGQLYIYAEAADRFSFNLAGYKYFKLVNFSNDTVPYVIKTSKSSAVIRQIQAPVYTSQNGTWTVQPGNTANSTPWLTNNFATGRTELRFYAVAAAAGSTGTETAISLTKSADTGATSSAASFTVTAGKKFRITHISVATRGNATATIQTTTFNLRLNTGGAVTTSSTPIILSARSATPAVSSEWDRYIIPIPDGLEIPGDGTLQWGITAAATYTTNAPTWDITIIGFEY